MRRIYLPGIVLTIVLMLLGILPTGLLTAPFSNTTVAAHEEASLGTHALDIVPRQVRDGSALRVGLHPGNAPLHLLFMLPFRDLAGLDAFLADVSNPRSANYGHYLTLKEANARFNPDVLHEERVQSWLRKSGFTDIHMSANHLYVEVSGDTAAFSTLLAVQINDYHTADRTFYAPDRAPTLPPSVANSIAWIHGLSNEAAWRTLPTMPQADTQAILNRNRLQTGEPAAANPNARATATATPTPTLGTPTATRTATSTGTATNTPTVTSTPTLTPITNGTANGSPPYNPQDLANAYDVNPLWTAGFNGQGQTIAIVSWFRPPTDTTLQRWASWTGAAVPTQANGRLVLVPIGNLGSTTCEDPGISGSAIESVAGMAYGATIRFYEIPSSGSCSLITFDAQNIATALNQAALDGSSVILETGLGDETAGAYSIYDHIYASNTATGHTYVAPSGWTGSASTFQPLRDPYPSYSAVSRYVTSVGRTRFSSSIGLTPAWPGEVAAAYTSAIGTALPDGSGGGFSLTPGTHPNWQVAPGFSTSETRRGYPDISVVGDSATGVFACWGDSATCGWVNVNVVGIWAGMIAVMNQYMIAQNRPTLGLVDPALYQLAGTSQPYAPYHDITSGTNGAYNAGTGWDPVTGLGSPDLWNLTRDLAVILPTVTPTNTPTATPTPCMNLTTLAGDDTFTVPVNSKCNVINTELQIGRFYGPLQPTTTPGPSHIDPSAIGVSVEPQGQLLISGIVDNPGVHDTLTLTFTNVTTTIAPTSGSFTWRIPVSTTSLFLPAIGSFPDPFLPLTPAVPPVPALNPLTLLHSAQPGTGITITQIQLILHGMRPLVIHSGFNAELASHPPPTTRISIGIRCYGAISAVRRPAPPTRPPMPASAFTCRRMGTRRSRPVERKCSRSSKA